jgi:hypothetical protein
LEPISIVASLLEEGGGQSVVKSLVMGVLNIHVVVDLQDDMDSVSEKILIDPLHSTTVTSEKFPKQNEGTHHIREVVTDAPQVRLQCSQERRCGGGHLLES